MRRPILMVICMLAFASTAWSFTVGTTDVGGLDIFKASTHIGQGGNPTVEAAWVNSILDPDEPFIVKDDPAQPWLATDTAGVYAFLLTGDPKYFLIKTGQLSSTTHDRFLFENIDNTSWAVLAFGTDSLLQIDNTGKVSHLDEFGTTPVPEPGTIMLLGAGFFGLAIYGKRRRNK